MEALRRILSCKLPHLFVSTRDLSRMVESGKKTSAAAVFKQLQEQRQSQPRYPRPVLGTLYIAPRNELEERIAVIWGELLGIEEIGIDDNFFELGGNSLMGLDLLARIRKTLKVENLPAYVLYEAPTVSALAEYIQPPQQKASALDDWDDEDEEEKRQEKMDHFKRIAQMEEL